jgi:hypothetical protein
VARSPRNWKRAEPLLGYVGAMLFAVALCALYVGAERTVYWWDYAGYHNLVWRTLSAFRESAAAGIAFVHQTLGLSYNALFAIPLAPLHAVFGSSRLTYVLSVALVYHVPYVAVLGGIAACTVHAPRRWALWATTTVALLLPGLWVPVLRGFPDSAAALLFALAILAYLADPALSRRWQPAAIGVCLASAVLLRRHFLVTVPAFLLAMAVVCYRERRLLEPAVAARRVAARTAWLAALTGAAGLAFALIVAAPFVRLVLTRDYYELYRGYMLPVPDVAYSFVAPFGIPIALAAAAGLALGFRSGLLRGSAALFVATEGLLAVAVWSLLIRQVGMQYAFHIAPAIVVGLVALGWTLWNGSRRARAGLILGLVYIVITFGVSLGFPPQTDSAWLKALLPADAAPFHRDDLEALRSLVDRLRMTCGPDQPILVVSSSYTLNSDLLVQAERQFYGRANTRLTVVPTAEVDTRDSYPVSRLIAAQCAVVAIPLQLHLAADEQDLLSVSHAMFRDRVGVARDFERDPGTLELRWGVQVEVFRRVRPTPPEHGLETLRLFESAIPEPPPTQPRWVMVGGSFPAWVTALADSATRIVLHPTPRDAGAATVAVHLGQDDGPLEVRGALTFFNPRCQGVELRIGSMALGGVEDATSIMSRPGTLPATFVAAVNVPEGRPLALLATIPEGQESIDYCLVRVDEIRVTTRAGG